MLFFVIDIEIDYAGNGADEISQLRWVIYRQYVGFGLRESREIAITPAHGLLFIVFARPMRPAFEIRRRPYGACNS
jgi:hypothetical protein